MKIKVNEKIIKPVFIVMIVILIIILFVCGNIINRKIKYKNFANENVKIYENNKEQVFKVEKILICSSANALDLSEKQNLQDMSIYQYTDIAVYINNGEGISKKNTVKKIYIDNISLEGTNDIGRKSLNYKNILKFGLKKENQTKSVIQESEDSSYNVFEKLVDKEKNTTDEETIEKDNFENNENDESDENADTAESVKDEIDFNVIYTNEENEKANYDEPTFYTDCSNPITLEYVNNDLVTHYQMDENKSVSFDGSLLKEVGISTESLKCKVKFKINIVNNDNEKYSCWINFTIPLDDIYEGTTMKAKTTTNQKYVFFRE